MKGTVLAYDETSHTGIISGYDGQRYKFVQSDWMDKKASKSGIEVDFEPDDEGNAHSIIIVRSRRGSAGESMAKPGWALGLGIFIFFVAAVFVTDESDPIEPSDVGVIGGLAVIPVALGIISLATQETGRIHAVIGLTLAVLGALTAFGALP